MGELCRRLTETHDWDRADLVRDWAKDHGGALDAADLQELADGPIIDPIRLYLPMGRCSLAELRRRGG